MVPIFLGTNQSTLCLSMEKSAGCDDSLMRSYVDVLMQPLFCNRLLQNRQMFVYHLKTTIECQTNQT